ncbi:MAG TPA: UDP-N-acetylmuramoyl-L-alanyl-D-glutamate--2,6-diaminopimelate ligase [Thermodesulfovibrionia bacterium]|nr:UDP-N-acetylmuramoyl-L-alanyl-D-glutamate--2,6-diaminopimelate ligase [Thermodesulfovibrionia bacterium]
MKLSKLVSYLDTVSIRGSLEKHIRSIAYDSRKIQDNDLFVALKGYKVDGHRFIDNAIHNGAVCVVVELADNLPQNSNVCFIQVQDAKKALARLASAFYRIPSSSLNIVGVTGTNGKTTTTHILSSIFEKAGHTTGLLGTIYNKIGSQILPAVQTTPASLELQGFLRQMVDAGVDYAVLEVSSHALALNRMDGCTLAAAGFTNFTRDHLDFHMTMDEYFAAKKAIFQYVAPYGVVALNHDDQAVNELAKGLRLKTITCGLQDSADVRASHIENTRQGLKFQINTPESSFTVTSSLTGLHNVRNILMASGLALGLGIRQEAVVDGVEAVRRVPGRFEKIDLGNDRLGIVDYAHTDDALNRLLSAARAITRSKIITIFGCGGDRDKGKRPLMGRAASELSDSVIITSDNPRTEEPMSIIRDILTGIQTDNYRVIPDRHEAIFEAVRMALPGDTVVIAGKGHEDYQETGTRRIHFSDSEVLLKSIETAEK